jgi:sugar diacid utilization regulator
VADYASWAAAGHVRDTMLNEGIVSVVCAPMLRGESVVGVLYAANRRATRFASADVSIVTALATQASAAIGNGRLYQTLMDKTRLLEATFEMHRALGAAAVTDIGIEGVVDALCQLTGRRLLLEQQIVPPFELFVGGPSQPTALSDVAAVIPVRRSEATVGRITVFGADPLSDLEQNAFAHGATVLALELMKYEAAHDVEWRLRGELLEQLLEAGDDRSDALEARARRFGVDLRAPCTMVAVEASALDPPALRGLIQRVIASGEAGVNRRSVLSGQRGERVIVALFGSGQDLDRFVGAIAATAVDPRAPLWIGTSTDRPTIGGAFREAAACARLARQASAGATRIIHGAALGPLRFMLDIHDVENARAYVEEKLGAVAEHEEAGGAQLLTTLRAYIEEDGHHQRVASRCHIHVSTVKYRLARIAELLGRPLQPWETRFEITLAFRLADLLRSIPQQDARRSA